METSNASSVFNDLADFRYRRLWDFLTGKLPLYDRVSEFETTCVSAFLAFDAEKSGEPLDLAAQQLLKNGHESELIYHLKQHLYLLTLIEYSKKMFFRRLASTFVENNTRQTYNKSALYHALMKGDETLPSPLKVKQVQIKQTTTLLEIRVKKMVAYLTAACAPFLESADIDAAHVLSLSIADSKLAEKVEVIFDKLQ